ncbi:glycosyltransferase, partial [Burkholderia cenocepacia]
VKRHTSRLYNATTRIVSRTPGTDNNSGFKAMRAEVARSLVPMLYGEYHRYLTVIAHRAGFVIDQVDVRHRARTAGVSKYGVARFWRGFVDLLSIRFLLDYQHRPQHLFAGIGAVTSVVGAGILGVLVVQWLLGSSIGDRPLLIAGVLLFLAGLQMLLFGLLAELVVAGRHRDRAWLD